ncbi:hypothetical protein T484DRAFT_1748150 [Baffinella frigidus]|nr:hypothetical protein T484DRAFT_1748150 [Cryptophyta sp. CCMP2293]
MNSTSSSSITVISAGVTYSGSGAPAAPPAPACSPVAIAPGASPSASMKDGNTRLTSRAAQLMLSKLFDLEDYAGTYRETRNAYLKAANQLKLATGPYKAARDAYVAATATYTKSLYE